MAKKLFFIHICIILLLTGCWDKVEINRRVFVTSVGIDKLKGEDTKNIGMESQLFPDLLPNRYRMVFAAPNTGSFAGKTQGEPRYVLSATGVNMVDIEKNMDTRLGGVSTFDHTKVFILGQELVKDSRMFREVLDHMERSPEIGRKSYIMVTPGEAFDVVSTEVDYEPPILGLYLRDLIEKIGRMARIANTDFRYILRTLHESNATIIPRIVASEKEVKVSGMGVIKDYSLVGWIGEIETLSLMVMLDQVNTLNSNIKLGDDILSGTITDSKTNMKAFEKDGRIIVSFDIEMEGSLRQHLFGVEGQTTDVKYLEKVEKQVEEYVKSRVVTTYKRFQTEFGADLIQLGEYLRKYEPELWEKVKDNWDEVFPQTGIEVRVDMKIRRYGVAK